MAACLAKHWSRPVPVQALQSDLTGPERLAWASRLSVAENKKTRSAMSQEDRADAAWQAAVADTVTPTISNAETARTFGVSQATVGIMRRTVRELREHGTSEAELDRIGWRRAQSVLRNHQGGTQGAAMNWEERQAHLLARQLAPVMKTRPSASALAAALEAYSPGIVREMSFACQAETASGDDD